MTVVIERVADRAAGLRDRAYWQRRLADKWHPMALPPIFGVSEGAQESVAVTLSSEACAAVNGRTRNDPVNIAALVALALTTIARGYSEFEGAAAVGLQVARRTGSGIDVAVLLDSSPRGSVRDALQQVRHEILEACAHASQSSLGLEALAREMGHERLFEIEIVIRADRAVAEMQRAGALQLDCVLGERITLSLRGKDEIYSCVYKESILNNLSWAIEQIASRPQDQLDELCPYSPEEQKRALGFGQGPSVPFTRDRRLGDVLEARAKEMPDTIAVYTAERRWSYRELNSCANQLARHLSRRGVGREDRVAVLLERGPDMLIAIYAILKAGAAYVPIDLAYPEARKQYILSDCGARVVIAKSDQPSFDTLSIDVLRVDDPALAEELDDDLGAPGSSEDLAYLIYTSGSTGKPKGVMIEHRSVFNRIEWMQRQFQLGPGHVILQKTPISFDVSVWELFWWAFAGAAVSLLAPNAERDPEALLRTVERDRVTHMHFVPSMLEAFLEYISSKPPSSHLSSLAIVFCSGEALGLHQCNKFASSVAKLHGTRLVNLYGPTEATVDVTWHECSTVQSGTSIPIGRPIDNTNIYVVDAQRGVLPLGMTGELCIGGVNLARGYQNRAELTSEKFRSLSTMKTERVYWTGDLARWTADGTLEYLGRIDHQVKIRGYRIELGEIEASLLQCDAVQQARVIARTRGETDKYLCAYVIGEPGFDEGRCREQLLSQLPDYMVPPHVLRVAEFPLTPNGKLDRAALPDPLATRLEGGGGVPTSELEKTLAQIWSDVLKVKNVGITDNFFNIGGDSISFLAVLSKVRKAGLDITFQQLFRHPTIAALCRSIGETGPAEVTVGEVQLYRPFSMLSQQDHGKLPDGAEEAYPLSMLQAGLIFQSELIRGASWYHDIQSYTFKGAFDRASFKAAVSRLVAEHPMLRTSYHLDEFAEFTQVVHRNVPPPLFIENWSDEPAARQEKLFAEFIARESTYRFKWSEPGLVRIHIQVLSPESYRYNLSFHDSALDGWSINLLHVKLFNYYYCFRAGTVPPAGPPDDFLRRYVEAEGAALRSIEAASYWRNVLDQFETVRVPRLRASSGGLPVIENCDVPIEQSLSDGIRALAVRLSVPVKTVLLAAHMVVLALMTSRFDVLTGYEHSGRPEEENADQAIALFLNTVPFGLRLSAAESWADLVARVYATESELLPYRRFPMARMKETSGRSGPLFETIFNFTHFYVLKELQSLQGLETLDVRILAETEFPLRAEFSQHHLSNDVRLNLHYHANEFDRRHIECIGGYYVEALAQMVDDCTRPYTTSSLIGAPELREIETFSKGKRGLIVLGVTLIDIVHHHFDARSDAIAIRDSVATLSYRQLEQHSAYVAGLLCRLGLPAEAVVGVAIRRGTAWAATVLGTLRSGAAYLPLDLDQPDDRIRAMIEDAACRVLICMPEDEARMEHIAAALAEPVAVIAVTMPSEAATVAVPAHFSRTQPEQLAYILFTSGSTGRPKGAMIEHRGMLNHLYAKVEDLKLTAWDVVAQTAPASFDISIWQLLVGAVTGCTVVIYSREEQLDPATFVGRLVGNGVTILELVPSYFAALLDYLEANPTAFKDLRYLLLTGETLNHHLLTRWFKLYPAIPVVNAYGPTEASDDVTHHIMTTEPSDGAVPIGRPLRNTRIHVLDAWRQPVPIGSTGEIWISGEGVGRGYIGAPDKTAEAFLIDAARADWPLGRLYRTGDLGRWRVDGCLAYLGRADEQVKIHGMRIELGEIENALLTIDGVREAAVIADTSGAGTRLIAFLVGVSCTEGVRKSLSDRLPAHMVPDRILAVEALPLSVNGKVDKAELAQIARAVPVDVARHEEPANDSERYLVGLWSAVLRIPPERIGRSSDFFELGGNSLLAMATAMRSARRISIAELFQHRQLADLAAHLARETVPQREVLQLLTPDAAGSGLAVVSFSYAGGNAVNFVPVAEALTQAGSGLCMFGVEPPGHSGVDDDLIGGDELASRCCEELAARGISRVIAWGHCAGAGLAVAFAAAAARRNIEVSFLVLAAKLLRDASALHSQIAEAQASSDAAVIEWLASVTNMEFDQSLSPELVAHLGRTFRHDTISANRVLLRLWGDDAPPLECPIINVLTVDDPLTRGDEALHSNWRRAGPNLRLHTMQSGGHYLMKSRARWMADFLQHLAIGRIPPEAVVAEFPRWSSGAAHSGHEGALR